MAELLKKAGVKFEHIHTHTKADDLKALVDAVGSKMFMPVHTERPEMFHQFNDNVLVLKMVSRLGGEMVNAYQYHDICSF